MKVDIKHDLATLTTINELAINRVFDKASWCICDAVEAAILNNENTVEVDIGFGTIILKIEANNVIYKFKPSRSLDKAVINTIINEENELTFNIENNLVNKFESIYKDMF